ncbi:Phosphate-regulating neutral endopeptidase [Aphelenchoides bicaudatus]|nr:Phosphate-regulating neutral endopeptidase [Aphelenchoides bicaudatus]
MPPGWSFIVFLCLISWCEASTECKDKVDSCDKASHLCKEQGKKADVVKKNCLMTCGFCRGKKEGCTDNTHCAAWAKNGFCNVYGKKKREELCPRACKAARCKGGRTTDEPESTTEESTTTTRGKKYQVFAQSMDEKVNPCHDFYRFSCGKYIKKHPPTQPTDNFATFNDINDRVIEQQIVLIAQNDPTSSTAIKKMRMFRDKCMNTAALERERTEQLRKDFTTIGKCPIFDSTWKESEFDLTKSLIEMTKLTGEDYLLDFEVTFAEDTGEVAIIFSPADMIIKNITAYSDMKMADKLQALHDFLGDIMGIVSLDAKSSTTFAQIKKAIDRILLMETKVAEIMKKNGYNTDPNKPPVLDKRKYSDLQSAFTILKWPDLLSQDRRFPKEVLSYFSKNPTIRLYNEKTLKELNAFYSSSTTRKETLANYLCVKFLIKQLPYLDSRFTAAGNRFAEKIDGSSHKSERPMDCFDVITENFGLVSDYLYVQKYLPKTTVRAMSNMIEDLRSGLSEVFKGEKWMSAATKRNAQQKIKKTRKIIGAVDDAKSPAKLDKRYSGIQLSSDDTFQRMAAKAKEYKVKENLMWLINPSLASEAESMRATEITGERNAHLRRELIMSAAILQPLFFDSKQPAAVNYGGIGFIIGHEFTHGFDTGGANYDESGKKKDWWDAETKREFSKRAKCFVDLYSSQMEPNVNKYVDGNLTIPENVADNGGIRAAYRAYKKHLNGRKERHVKGYRKYTNAQTFFIAYGTSFCSSLAKEQIESRLVTDSHSPTEFRVNVVLANYPAFSKAFKCKPGSRMNPQKKCKIW